MNGSSGIKVDMVNMSEAIQDQQGEIIGGGEPSLSSLPDLEKLSGNIFEILEYLEQPDVKKIRDTNESLIRINLINKYADKVPLKFIDLFMEKDDDIRQESIERTIRWIEAFSRAQNGTEDFETVCQNLVHEANHRYAYSKYGGKEGFDKALKKEMSKNSGKMTVNEF